MIEAVVTPPAPAEWYRGVQGVDPELIGHIENKGWKGLNPQDLALKAAHAHREAEKFVGVPANQLLKLPTDPKDEAGWNAVYNRLGVPADAKDYDFKDVKFADGTALDEGFTTALREAAKANHLSKDAASALAQTFAKQTDAKRSSEQAQYTANLEKERAELFANWGANKDSNLVVARNAAAALGVGKEQFDLLEKNVGYSKVMEMFRNIGTKIGEDKFVLSPSGSNQPMTREAAKARLSELERDKSFTTRYMNGDIEAGREMSALVRLISSKE